MGQEYVAKLNNWSVQQASLDEVMIWGNIEEDPLGRFYKGQMIHTSGIKNGVFKEGDIVTTRNNKYLLGKEQGVPANLSEESEVCKDD